MASQPETYVFAHGREGKAQLFLPILFTSLTFPITLLGVLAYSVGLLTSAFGASPLTPDDWKIFIPMLFALAFLVQVSIPYVNEFNKIEVLDRGIKVRAYFLFYFWRFIPWNEIVGVEKASGIDPFGGSVWVIKVKRLSLFHRLLSSQFRTGPQPVIPLISLLDRREELIRLIEEGIHPGQEFQAFELRNSQ